MSPGTQHVSFASPPPGGSPGASSGTNTSSSSTNSSPSDAHAVVMEPDHTAVPLSSVPPEVLGVHAAAGKPAGSRHARKGSRDSTGADTAISGRSGRLSQAWAAEKSKAEELKLRINRPRQVTGLPQRYHQALAWAGRIGWMGKAVVYAMIGGLACKAAVGDDTPDPRLPQTEQVAASPQGAFVLLSTAGEVSIAILLVMLVALAAYIVWRFWEGLAGQGYDETFSARKNCFKFRVSPIVSGAVYVSYMIFLINVLDRQVRGVHTDPGPAKEGWPATWRHSAGGRVGLALLGIAFVIATCIQLQGVLTRQWHRDYRSDLPKWLMTTVFTIGHLGFAGRAGAFLAMAILFFKDAGGADAPHSSSMVANALQQLQTSRGLRAVLMIVGILLVLYSLFATLSACTRMFPTPPPSRRKRVPAAEYKAHKECKEAKRRSWGLPRHSGDAAASTSISHGDDQQQHRSSTTQPAVLPEHQAGATAHTATSAVAADPVARQLAPNGPSTAPLPAALSAASSDVPVMLDESPGWGRDQGLTNSSLNLDKVAPASTHPQASQGTEGPPAAAGAASRALGHS